MTTSAYGQIVFNQHNDILCIEGPVTSYNDIFT